MPLELEAEASSDDADVELAFGGARAGRGGCRGGGREEAAAGELHAP
jgi:hypothetical protein